jgi:hypothetical protein
VRALVLQEEGCEAAEREVARLLLQAHTLRATCTCLGAQYRALFMWLLKTGTVLLHDVLVCANMNQKYLQKHGWSLLIFSSCMENCACLIVAGDHRDQGSPTAGYLQRLEQAQCYVCDTPVVQCSSLRMTHLKVSPVVGPVWRPQWQAVCVWMWRWCWRYSVGSW